MNNAELIEAVRNCSDGLCSLCPYDDHELSTKGCEAKLMHDAAAALEEQQKQIEELKRNFSDVCNANGSLACERNELLNDVRELKAQLPKEGEWIGIDGTMFSECSVCGERHYGCETPFCDMCGAKMRTVTDCHTFEER